MHARRHGDRIGRRLRSYYYSYRNLLARPVQHEVSGKRWWHSAGPDSNLTWGIKLTGGEFVEKIRDYSSDERSILEVGPGYGRLLESLLSSKIPFKDYLGLDVSSRNLVYLKSRFANSRISFLRGDVESVELSHNSDLVISSLTFKHLYPSFEGALMNLGKYLNAGGILAFDLIERTSGPRESYDPDGVYIRRYRRDEIEQILKIAKLRLVKYETVTHAPGFTRLLVIAQQPWTSGPL